MMNYRQFLGMSVVLFGLFACANETGRGDLHLAYAFKDGPNYRVDSTYHLSHLLKKSHQGKVFFNEQVVYHAKAAYQLRVTPQPDKKILAQYTLLHLAIVDESGKFRMELGPETGSISWYQQETALGDYLGEDDFERYHQLLRQPLAQVTINELGVQLTDAKENSPAKFNFELLNLLGKNRVYGKIIVKNAKIPPVLMAVFPARAVRGQDDWILGDKQSAPVAEWEQGVETHFRLRAESPQRAAITLESRLDFQGSELTDLGRQFGFAEFDRVAFEPSTFQVKGKVKFDLSAGRPSQGTLAINKQYGLRNGEEQWELAESENYEFSLAPNP